MIFKFGRKVGYDKLYCVTKNQPHIAYQFLLFVHFSSSPTKISVTDFSASIGASVLKLCIHLEGGQIYRVNENQIADVYFAFFFKFSIFAISHSYVMHMEIFCQRFLSNCLT